LIATLLASTGMFALLAFAVGQRTREIGIRMAIGARHGDIVRVLVSQHVVPVGSGVVAGILLALVLGRVARSIQLVTPGQQVDPVGFAAGLACFALIAVLATLSPVLRALRIDPSSTLRHE
jgi:putative ABC transport system permease protein